MAPKRPERFRMSKGPKLGGTGCLIFLLMWGGLSYVMAAWTESNLNFWLTQLKGEAVDVNMFWAWLLTFFPPTFFLNIVSEVAEMAM